MPLHPVPIIIGTTLAVIGGGMAFKKFVYDPHLAPYIEAFISSHLTPSTPPIAEPISVHSHASSTRRPRPEQSERLRRRQRWHDDYELQEPLLARQIDTEFCQPPSVNGLPLPHRDSIDRQRLIGLDRPSSPQDAEIREKIFNHPPTPLRPVGMPSPIRPHSRLPSSSRREVDHVKPPDAALVPSSLSHARPLSPDTHLAPLNLQQYPESTAFSFLSLSQTSSPEVPHVMLSSITIDRISERLVPSGTSGSFSASLQLDGQSENPSEQMNQWTDIPRSLSPSPREEDVISLPDHDDEVAYSPSATPHRVHVKSPVYQSLAISQELDGLGMTSQADRVDQDQRGRLRRGPMSVVSLSESEGWGEDDDWTE